MSPFRFSGNAAEYFGIWIVNLFLTVVTVGLYSPWAKVRRRRYFYGNTWLAESNFDYHANPVAILKGRLIAFAAFVAYTVATHFSSRLGAVILLVLLPAVPWVILRSFAFNAVNSSYRNLRFRFSGSYRAALGAVAPLAVVPLASLMLPEIDPKNAPSTAWEYGLLFVPTVLVMLVYPYTVARLKLIHLNGSSYGTARFRCTAGVARFYAIYAFALVLLAGFIGLIWLAMDWLAGRYLALLFGVIPVIYLVGGAIIFGFTQSRVSNLVFNATDIEAEARFSSTLSARRLAFIYATNLLAVVPSLGLMIPWAAIRVARYRAECLALSFDRGVEEFVGAAQADVSATGEETGEMFDLDVSL